MQTGYQTMYQPMIPQQRIAPSYQLMQQPSYLPQQPPVQRVNAVLVTNREEAVAAQIPFDNSVNAYINMAAGEVYLKLFNPQTGGASLIDCVVKTQTHAQDTPTAFAPLDMVQTLSQNADGLKADMQNIVRDIADLRAQVTELSKQRTKRPATKEEAVE